MKVSLDVVVFSPFRTYGVTVDSFSRNHSLSVLCCGFRLTFKHKVCVCVCEMTEDPPSCVFGCLE